MPVVLIGVFLIALLFAGGDRGPDLANAAAIVFAAIAFPWGNRMIADSLTQEIAGNTWDRQRMSALGAWEMTWGKLFGSTIYVWYGGVICLAVFVVSLVDAWPGHEIFIAVSMMVLTAVFSHAVCFMFTLLAVRRQREYGPIRAGLYQFIAVIIGLVLLTGGLSGLFDGSGPGSVHWFGQSIPTPVFLFLTVGVWSIWAVAGSVAVMRAEFQQSGSAWLWLGHLVFSMLYIAGIDLVPEIVSRHAPWLPAGLFPAFCLAIAATYVTAFCEPKSRMTPRRLVQLIIRGQIAAAVHALPRFALGVMVIGTSAAAIMLAGLFDGSDDVASGASRLGLFTLSIFLFVVRDIVIILTFSAINPRFGERRAFVFLLIVYTALPALLSMLSLDALLPLFWPIWGGGISASVLPAAIQASTAAGALLAFHGGFSVFRRVD
jgi:hypothetical protein